MAEKSRGKAPAPPQGASDAGQLGKDDLGNVTWEWKDEGDLLADDEFGTAERLRVLVDPTLRIKADDDPVDPAGSGPEAPKAGYNPYNRATPGRQTYTKKKDLRELSEWIKLRRKVAEKKPDGT